MRNVHVQSATQLCDLIVFLCSRRVHLLLICVLFFASVGRRVLCGAGFGRICCLVGTLLQNETCNNRGQSECLAVALRVAAIAVESFAY